MAYKTKISRDSEGFFNALLLYVDSYGESMVPGIGMRSYATRKAAERGAALMLKKVAA